MPRIRDQAICIRQIDWSETSQIVGVLTREHGQVRGLAKGSKRNSPSAIAKFSGGIELLTAGEILAIIRPAGLATITEWDLQKPYWHLRRNLGAQHLAMYAADLIAALLPEHDPHPATFDELDRLLVSLANPGRPDSDLLRFQCRLLQDIGYEPQLHQNARTGLILPDDPVYLFDPHAGGLLQHDGRLGSDTDDAGPWRVRRETIDALRAGMGVQGDERITGFEDKTIERANKLLCVYIRCILDRDLPTMSVVLGRG